MRERRKKTEGRQKTDRRQKKGDTKRGLGEGRLEKGDRIREMACAVKKEAGPTGATPP